MNGILTVCCHAPLVLRVRFDAEVVLLRCSCCGRLAGAPGPEDSDHVANLINRQEVRAELVSLVGDWPEISHGRVIYS